MTSRRYGSLLVLCLLVGATATAAQTEVPLETDEQKILYALGLALSARLPSINPTEAEIEFIEVGLRDGLQGREPRVDMREYITKLDGFVNQRISAAAEKEKVAGDAFRAEQAKLDGAVTTDSGMIYFEVEPGTGAQPSATDSVTLHYHGTLPDGSVFDSSRQRGEPAQFALNGVVPCFGEGVQLMKVGGKAKLVCPPELAYGDRGSPPQIKPGATLVFEIELIGILQPGAATPPPAPTP
jgi:FKBP-type peptidyl-prolyl cis-trans isomerase